jgi:hypothetical protein
MLAVYFARDYPETTEVLALENPIGLEDYRSAIAPQSLETLIKTEMTQTPQSRCKITSERSRSSGRRSPLGDHRFEPFTFFRCPKFLFRSHR